MTTTTPNWDDRNGAGAVPNAATGEYFGWLARMTAQQWLDLQPARPRTSQYLVDQVAAGQPLGRPFVDVERDGDGWRVVGHEGRGRCLAIAQVLGPDTMIECWVWPRGMRRRHVADADTLLPLLPDRRCTSSH